MEEQSAVSTAPEAATAPAPAAAQDYNTMMLFDEFDPVALSGTTNARFAQRLAEQVAVAQFLPRELGIRRQSELGTAAVAALKALAPQNAMEALLAAQAVAAHSASLDLLQLAMRQPGRGKAANAMVRQHARLSDLVLRSLEQLSRLRGRQRQTIGIEHVRVAEDGKVTVRQEEERVRG
jgi:hypothetical protein